MGVSNIANLAGSSFAAGSSGKIPQDVHVVDANGTPVSFGGSGGTSSTDEATFTPTSSTGTPVMGAVDETSPDAAAEGTLAIVRSTLSRALHVNLRDASGNEVSVGGGTQYTEGNTDATITGTAMLFEGAGDALVAATGTAANGLDVDVTRVSGTVTVDGSGVTQPVSGTVTANLAAGTNNIGDVDVLSVVPGTGATNLGKAEDAAHTTGDVGVMALAVRSDAGGAIAGANGDYTPLQVDSAGALRVTGGGGGTEYTEGDTDVSLTGSVFLFETNTGTSAVGPVSSAAPLPVTLANTGANATPIVVDLGANNDVTVTGSLTTVSTVTTVTTLTGTTTLTPGTGATNLGKAEDAAHASGDVGVMSLAVRRDANTTLVDTDGDYAPLQVDASGSLKVAITAGAGSGGTSLADDAAFTPASTSFTPVGGIVTSDSVDAGDGGAFAMLANRQQKVTLYDSSGAELSVGGGTQYDEDTASASAQKLTMAGVTRADTAATQVDTDGDRSTLIVDASGRLHVNVGNTVAVGSHDVTNAGTFAVQAVGNVAHDAVDSGAPVKIGGTASAAAPTSVAGADRVQAWFLLNGAQATVITAAGALIGGDATNGLDVDVTRVIPGTTATALGKAEDAAHTTGDTGVMALAVRRDTQAASSGTTGDYEPLSTDSLGALWTRDSSILVDDAAFTPATSRVLASGFFADETATDSVDEGDVGASRMTLDRKQIVTPQPHTAGGLSIFRSLDLDETEEDVKTSAGCVYGVWFTNTATSTRWLKFYNATAASVTVGATTPVITLALPGNSSDDISGVFSSTHGIEFSTAICVAATTGVADADTGAPSANDVIVNIFYK